MSSNNPYAPPRDVLDVADFSAVDALPIVDDKLPDPIVVKA